MDKKNYRPVTVLSTIFEKLTEKQLNHYIQNHLSPYLRGYCKSYRTQRLSLALIKSWKKSKDNKGFGETILIDLSKDFDTLDHELLIPKLLICESDESSLKLLQRYL